MIAVSHVRFVYGAFAVALVLDIAFGAVVADELALTVVDEVLVAQQASPKGTPVPLWPPRGTSGGNVGSGGLPIAAPPISATSSTTTITVDQLSTPDSEVVGTLDTEMGGFGVGNVAWDAAVLD